MGLVVNKFKANHAVAKFLTIGTNVLHRSRTNGAGNAAHGLDARKPSLNGVSHKVIPVFASLHTNHNARFIFISHRFNAKVFNLNYAKATDVVGNNHVGATAKN